MAKLNPNLTQQPPLERATYSVTEGAQIVGVSRATMYEAVASGEVPSIKIRGRILIPKTALARLLEGQK